MNTTDNTCQCRCQCQSAESRRLLVDSPAERAKLMLGAIIQRHEFADQTDEFSRETMAWIEWDTPKVLESMFADYINKRNVNSDATSDCELMIRDMWPRVRKTLLAWSESTAHSDEGIVATFTCERELVLS